jgi:hypothetical protein
LWPIENTVVQKFNAFAPVKPLRQRDESLQWRQLPPPFFEDTYLGPSFLLADVCDVSELNGEPHNLGIPRDIMQRKLWN